MKKLPKKQINQSLMLRTDFSNGEAWESLCVDAQAENEDGFRAYLDCLNDPTYKGLTVEQLVNDVAKETGYRFVFLFDRVTLTHPERPILVVDLDDEPGRTFRVIPSEMWGVENNLSIANMDYYEFADNMDDDGIFRGFR